MSREPPKLKLSMGKMAKYKRKKSIIIRDFFEILSKTGSLPSHTLRYELRMNSLQFQEYLDFIKYIQNQPRLVVESAGGKTIISLEIINNFGDHDPDKKKLIAPPRGF